MKYRLICLDIDGTLLNDEKRIPELVKESVQRASDMGIRIALITGRMPAAAEMIEEELGISCIKACSAGTCILMKDACIHSRHLESWVMQRIYREVAVKHELPLWIFRGRSWYVTAVDAYVRQETECIHRNPEIADVDVLAEQWKTEGTGPNKLLFGADPKKIERIQRELEHMDLPVSAVRSADTYLEIPPKGVTKGTAMEVICRELAVPLENTIAFGDQELDLSMIQKAGIGIAMGNAIEELKKAADFVTLTNNDSGIAYALCRYLTEGGQ